jgi:hypothetical protein
VPWEKKNLNLWEPFMSSLITFLIEHRHILIFLISGPPYAEPSVTGSNGGGRGGRLGQKS